MSEVIIANKHEIKAIMIAETAMELFHKLKSIQMDNFTTDTLTNLEVL